MDTVPVCPSPAKSPVDPAQLYVEHRSFVRSVLLRKGIAPRDVDDLVQEVFVVVLLRIGDLDPTHSPRPWLYVIAAHLASNYRGLARHKREQYPGEVPDEPAELESAESLLESSEESAHLRRRVSRLRPKIRAVVIPYVFEGRLISEITKSLKIPEKTAYARLRLARNALTRRPRAPHIQTRKPSTTHRNERAW